jgi:ADP-ribose pyrophosphatase YjhB (NUDIX family)
MPVDELRIRPIAIALIRRGDDLLAAEFHDPTRDITFCRPLGGGIEFGESADEALRREFDEEIGAELTNVRLLGVRRFHGFGRAGHEIVFVFAAELADASLYAHDPVAPIDDEDSVAAWHPLSRFADGSVPLYPEGALDLLQ